MVLNQIVFVGRVKRIRKDKNVLVVASPDSNNPESETVIQTTMSDNTFSGAKDYLKVGDMVGLKGHFKNDDLGQVYIYIDKLTFLQDNNG